jgi:hypothetical protein
MLHSPTGLNNLHHLVSSSSAVHDPGHHGLFSKPLDESADMEELAQKWFALVGKSRRPFLLRCLPPPPSPGPASLVSFSAGPYMWLSQPPPPPQQ